MGLDISGIVFSELEEGCAGYDIFVDHTDFKRSLLDSEITKVGKDHENVEEVGDVPSMSYGSYGSFRRELSLASTGKKDSEVWEEVANMPEEESYPNPMYHIINFSDCEGYIGPKAVTEMASFLEANVDKIRKHFKDHADDWYLGRFEYFLECVVDTSKKNGYLRLG